MSKVASVITSAVVIFILGVSNAYAVEYNFNADSGGSGLAFGTVQPSSRIDGNPAAGVIDSFSLNWDDQTEVLGVSISFIGKTEGFWLAVNEGPDPKGGDVGVIYVHESLNFPGDVTASIYNYNAADPFADVIADQDQTWVALSNDSVMSMGNTTTYMFNLDVGWLNDNVYSGFIAGFEDLVGFWLHWFDEVNPVYSNDVLTQFQTSSGNEAWWDASDVSTNTTEVPEPGTMALLGVALGGVALRRRRQQSE